MATYPDAASDPAIAHRAVEMRHEDSAGTILARSRRGLDPLGRVAAVTGFLWEPEGEAASARAITTLYAYDRAGQLSSVTDPRGHTTTWGYDAAGRLSNRTDAKGNYVAWTLDPNGNPVYTQQFEKTPQGSVVPISETAVFDALDRRTSERDALGNETKKFYDARGNVLAQVDATGHLTSRTYDSLDRMTEEVLPEGIAVRLGYDAASRPTSYQDALNHGTSYTYDALGRQVSVTYPDSTQVTSSYDAAGNLEGWTDANGSVVSQTFDAAGRLSGRTVVPATGVIGPTSESFDHDALSRLILATSGGVTSTRTFDSLSRLVSDTTAGKSVRFDHDDVGNVVGETWPSFFAVRRDYDELDRLSSVGENPLGEFFPSASYLYQGAGRVAGKLAHDVTASRTRDAAGRMLSETAVTPNGSLVFGERISWSPRGLKIAQGRSDLNGLGYGFGYDGAGQLTQVAAMVAPASDIPNNSTFSAAAGSPPLSLQSHDYDQARNLLSRLVVAPGIVGVFDTPPDASGRNRPAAAGGVALSYDANGNLTHKGDLRLEYDFRNRLTRVSRNGTEVARYTYDAFDRRVEKLLPGGVETTAWSGWRPVETTWNGLVRSRQIYGLGLDEIAELHSDVDGDGELETRSLPWYDSTGNPALLATTDGRVVERYSYTPFGDREIRVDATRPRIELLRSRNEQIWLDVSEQVLREQFYRSLELGQVRLEDTSQVPPVEVPMVPEEIGGVEAGLSRVAPFQAGSAATYRAESSQSARLTAASTTGPVTMSGHSVSSMAHRLQTARRLVLGLPNPPAEGTPLRLVIAAGAVEDPFLNSLAGEWSQEFTWSSDDTVIVDVEAPEVHAVGLREGHLEVTFSEEPDLATATAAIDAGTPLTWTLSDDRYTLRSEETLAAGTFTFTVAPTLTDLAGTSLPSLFSLELTVEGGAPNADFFVRPDPRLVETSTAGYGFGFHGLPVDAETGLVYVRHRYYDPETGRFLTADPVGYVDGPNVYQYGLNDPVNLADPLGLYCLGVLGEPSKKCSDYVPELGPGYWSKRRAVLAPATQDMSLTDRERIVASLKVNAQIPLFFLEEAGRGILNTPHRVAKNTEIAADLFAEAQVNAVGIDKSDLPRFRGRFS